MIYYITPFSYFTFGVKYILLTVMMNTSTSDLYILVGSKLLCSLKVLTIMTD